MSTYAGSSEEELRLVSSEHLNSCHNPGSPGYCDPDKADWSIEVIDASLFHHLWDSPKSAMEWIASEIEMCKEEGLERDWEKLLTEDIRDEIVSFIRDDQAYIWDGHHRAAALIATGRPIHSITGRLMESESAPHRAR